MAKKSLTSKLRTIVPYVATGILGAAVALGVRDYSGSPNSDYVPAVSQTQAKDVQRNYQPKDLSQKLDYSNVSLDEFKRALGNRVIPERERKLGAMWSSSDPKKIEERQILAELYMAESIKDTHLPEKWKTDYDSFDPDSISEESLNELQKVCEWRIEKVNGRYDEGDKRLIYVQHKIGEEAAKAVIIEQLVAPYREMAEEYKNK